MNSKSEFDLIRTSPLIFMLSTRDCYPEKSAQFRYAWISSVAFILQKIKFAYPSINAIDQSILFWHNLIFLQTQPEGRVLCLKCVRWMAFSTHLCKRAICLWKLPVWVGFSPPSDECLQTIFHLLGTHPTPPNLCPVAFNAIGGLFGNHRMQHTDIRRLQNRHPDGFLA